MVRKIWAFGDSFTQSLAPVDGLSDWRQKYTEYKGYVPKVFTDFLSEDHKFSCINRGHGGADNYTILDIIINHLDQIKDGDIIIIGWSSVERVRLANKFGKFTTMHSNWDENHKKMSCNLMGISINTMEELLVNRHDSSCYVSELNGIIKLLNHTFKNNMIIHWSPFCGFFPGMDVISLPPIETISTETENKVHDGHYSENGHKTLSKHLHEVIDYTIIYNEKLYSEFYGPIKKVEASRKRQII
jgi:hypothetical protein